METRLSWDWKGRPSLEDLKGALEPFGLTVQEDPDFERTDSFGYVISDEVKVEVDPEVEALIRWRDERALDWCGEELISHVCHMLSTYREDSGPHQAGHQKFLALSEDERYAAVRHVLGG